MKSICKFEKKSMEIELNIQIDRLKELNRNLKKTIVWAIVDKDNNKEVEDIQNRIALNNIKIEKLKGGK